MNRNQEIESVKTKLIEYFAEKGNTDFSLEDPEPGLSQEEAPIHTLIDHTVLKPDATTQSIEVLCQEAIQYEFASVCVNPHWVAMAAKLLKDAVPKVATVIGFPLGATTSATKAFETQEAVRNGADEVDMVINVGALKSGDFATVYSDIKAVVDAAGPNTLVKVIIETALLTEEEKIAACILASAAEADFVKTSTGFAKGGATVEDVALMRAVVGSGMGVKASGGVRDFDGAMAMVEAGATRIGTSSGVSICQGTLGKESY